MLPGMRLLTCPAPSLRTPSLWTPSGFTAKKKARAAIVEGVEVEDDVVFVVDVVPVGHRGSDGGRRGGRWAMTPKWIASGAVPDQHLGLLLRGAAIHWLILPEAGQPGGLDQAGSSSFPSIWTSLPVRGSLRWASLCPGRPGRAGP